MSALKTQIKNNLTIKLQPDGYVPSKAIANDGLDSNDLTDLRLEKPLLPGFTIGLPLLRMMEAI